ncbi:hypothetical protein MFUL124B02_26445 [Myxococcus fulvus 124B02]|nr:hypothetical protein MFUL124B02_26445 [Myxococcus fulvus 124B02]
MTSVLHVLGCHALLRNGGRAIRLIAVDDVPAGVPTRIVAHVIRAALPEVGVADEMA